MMLSMITMLYQNVIWKGTVIMMVSIEEMGVFVIERAVWLNISCRCKSHVKVIKRVGHMKQKFDIEIHIKIFIGCACMPLNLQM